MSRGSVPQPGPDRMVDFAGHPAVAGVVPGRCELVAATAARWALAVGAPAVHFAYCDPSRYPVAEHADGTVAHAPVDPDEGDDHWLDRYGSLHDGLAGVLADSPATWTLTYLAGRPDRALTHLARAVDAAVLIVGSRAPGPAGRMRAFFEGSVAVHLARHQHRPVLTVPLSVVDWKETRSEWDG
ncbi:universal stress protein [Nocardiopsis coralliicola]